MKYVFTYKLNGVTVQEFKSVWVHELLDKFRARSAAQKYTPSDATHEFEVRNIDTNFVMAYYIHTGVPNDRQN